MESEDIVVLEQSDGIATITLNRPHKLNAFTDDSMRMLRQHLETVDDDENVLACVIRGAGRAFSSGADVNQRALRTPAEFRKQGNGPSPRDAHTQDMLMRFANWKPVIAAVHGYVLGAGLLIAMSCEAIVAAESTQLQVTEVPRGLGAVNHWWTLRDLGGGAWADEVSLTGRFWSAGEGLDHNVVTSVVPDGTQYEAALDLAKLLAGHPPMAVREVVRARRIRMEQAFLSSNSMGPRNLHLSGDFAESAHAFLEKREPNSYSGV